MFCYGFFLGSVGHLIANTVTGDLGRGYHSKEATSTITGIIDGIGSSGNGIGQIIVGRLVEEYSWRWGFLLPVSVMLGLTLVPFGVIFQKE